VSSRWTWCLLLLGLIAPLAARAADEPTIIVAPLITAELSAVIDFNVRIETTAPLPPGSSVTISGLPKFIVFSAGQTAGPGVWQVPVSALKDLKMVVTSTETARSNLLIILSAQDKGLRILASARSVLVVDTNKELAQLRRAEEAKKLEAARAAEQEKLALAKRAEEARAAAEAEAAERQRQVLKAQEERVALEKAEAQARELAKQAEADERRRLELKAQEERAASEKAEAERSANAKAEEARKTETATAPPQADATTPPTASPAPDAAAGVRLLKRGEEALGQGNVLEARLYFLRAAQTGNAEAAFKLAETHDPHELARLGVRGVVPDPAQARTWYARALQLGVAEAKARLTRLGQ
jgi:hypothetical protein